MLLLLTVIIFFEPFFGSLPTFKLKMLGPCPFFASDKRYSDQLKIEAELAVPWSMGKSPSDRILSRAPSTIKCT